VCGRLEGLVGDTPQGAMSGRLARAQMTTRCRDPGFSTTGPLSSFKGKFVAAKENHEG